MTNVTHRDFIMHKVFCQIVFLFGWFVASTVSATEPPITALAFAPDGKSVVATSQSGIQIYSWPNLKLQKTIETSATNLHCLAFSPNGKKLAIGGGNPAEDGSIEIFAWPSGEFVTMLTEHKDSVMSVAWSSHSKILSASLDREIKLWDIKKQSSQRIFKGHSRGVSTLCLLKDGKTLVSSGDDQSVRVWDLESGKLVRSLNQHTKPVHAIALRPATGGLPMVASASSDRTIRFWQPTIGRLVRYIRLDSEPLSIAWMNETFIAASCVDGHVRIINADEVKVTQNIKAINGWAYAIAVHPSDGSLVLGGTNGEIRKITPTIMSQSN